MNCWSRPQFWIGFRPQCLVHALSSSDNGIKGFKSRDPALDLLRIKSSQVIDTPRSFSIPHFQGTLLNLAVLAVAITVLIWLIFRIRMLFREDKDPTAFRNEMLLQFRDLHRQGDLSEEEYRSIKGQLLDDGTESTTNNHVESSSTD